MGQADDPNKGGCRGEKENYYPYAVLILDDLGGAEKIYTEVQRIFPILYDAATSTTTSSFF